LNRILLDQRLPRSAVKILTIKGWDVLHTGDIGLGNASDLEIINYAREDNRIVITLDADFHVILAVENAQKPSVIRIRQEGLKGNALAELIEKIWPRIDSQLDRGALITVTEKSIRVRMIPIVDKEVP